MTFTLWQRMAALFVLGLVSFTAQAQTPTQAAAPAVVPMPKGKDLARADKRAIKPTMKTDGEKKKSKRFSYSYLLPFGVGQFEQDKTIMGTALATTQAGFLLLYFDRMNAVRSSNADAADVMRGVDMNAARNDPTTLAFLNQNEAYTLKAQQQANMALIGFFALYTAGVVEAVFDPLSYLGLSNKKSKPAKEAKGGNPSRLVQDLREEEKDPKIGVFYAPAPGSASAVGVALQKPL